MFFDFIKPYEKIACIGMAYFTFPEKQQNLCQTTGFLIASYDKILVSGNAKGSDNSFAQGANSVNPEKVSLYLPNKEHYPEHIVSGNKITYQEEHPEWAEIAKANHKYYHLLNAYVKTLFNRNVGIIFNSDCVIALPDMNKKDWGGTGHSMRVAKSFNKPILNIAEIDVTAEIKQLAKEMLQK